MATLPSLPDLTVHGVTPEFFLERLKDDVSAQHSAIWIVRWNNRIRAISGIAFFNSREAAHEQVIRWLRDQGRWALSWDREVTNRLPRNWSYKKAYREYIDRLAAYLEETGYLEYVELQPPSSGVTRPDNAPQSLIG